MTNTTPLGAIYTKQEAAARLHMSLRNFHNLIAKYPFYAQNGRRKLFSDADINNLWEAMRCQSSSSSAAASSISAAPSTVSQSTKARGLLTNKRRRLSERNAKRA